MDRVNKKASLADYWRKSNLYLSTAAKFMLRNRFKISLRILHFRIMSNVQKETDYTQCNHLLTHSIRNYKKKIFCLMKTYALTRPWLPFVGHSSSVSISRASDISLESNFPNYAFLGDIYYMLRYIVARIN